MLWHLLKYQQELDWKVFEKEEAKMKGRKLARLQTLAASLNYQLTPLALLMKLVSQERTNRHLADPFAEETGACGGASAVVD